MPEAFLNFESVWSSVLLADSYGRHAARYLRNYGTGYQQYYFFLSIGCLAIFWALLMNWERMFKALKVEEEPVDILMGELAEAHQLSRQDISVLTGISERLSLEHPAVLFVEAKLWPELLTRENGHITRLKRIHRQIFGSDLKPRESAG